MIANDTPTASAERTTQLLRELFSQILQRSAGQMLRVMSEVGLSMPQMVALHMLRNCGPYTISALAEKLSLSLAATSHLVDRMVQQGLVARTEDAADRRQKQVAIAPAGTALLERLVEARLAETSQVISLLAPELRQQLEIVLAQALGQIKREML
ncbi:MAG TPA: MarR family transcriptional regulator [Kouleothrix sp.]|uniref:MarR family winged helix-turn-helix transcriptional regulator n=1 Tax=Kouleothrix sp. TaxID=2779161 RepID=UPI002C277A7C|nr:MarR family transcriptional regulator [Kouleothrix sp.]HRC76450.1 MarR family transcriptional regulator [Kouleothrix sp.]